VVCCSREYGELGFLPFLAAIPSVAWYVVGAVTAVVGGVAAYNLTKKDAYSMCVKSMVKSGYSPATSAQRCLGAKEPSLSEKIITPMLIAVGAAITIPPIIMAIRRK